jgi:hypothetical protein
MKRSSNKKNYLVILDNKDNTYNELTIPCTSLQAIRWIVNKNFLPLEQKGIIKMVTLEEYKKMNEANHG